MSFSLPELPYAHDALAPYMSRETLEYHHDKHHLAYVNNGNSLRQDPRRARKKDHRRSWLRR
jgi:superoxide dismutase